MSMQADKIRTSLTVPESQRSKDFPDQEFFYGQYVLHNGVKAIVLMELPENPGFVKILYDVPITDERINNAYIVKASELVKTEKSGQR